jgi:hypothetical protein
VQPLLDADGLAEARKILRKHAKVSQDTVDDMWRQKMGLGVAKLEWVESEHVDGSGVVHAKALVGDVLELMELSEAGR